MTDQLTSYRDTLRGIASCATQCGCCEMHRRVAQAALDKIFAQAPLAPFLQAGIDATKREVPTDDWGH